MLMSSLSPMKGNIVCVVSRYMEPQNPLFLDFLLVSPQRCSLPVTRVSILRAVELFQRQMLSLSLSLLLSLSSITDLQGVGGCGGGQDWDGT